MASNGQTSTQIWQLMQTEISMSKTRGIELQLADGIRLLVLALVDVDALGRAFLFANLAGDAAQAGLIGSVRCRRRGTGSCARSRSAAMRSSGYWTVVSRSLVTIAAHEISGRLRHAFDDAFA